MSTLLEGSLGRKHASLARTTAGPRRLNPPHPAQQRRWPGTPVALLVMTREGLGVTVQLKLCPFNPVDNYGMSS
jgi:hypothetical protein